MSRPPSRPHPSAAPVQALELRGQECVLRAFNSARDSSALWQAFGKASNPALWQNLPIGPFVEEADFAHWLLERAARQDMKIYSIFARLPTQEPGELSALGLFFLLRLNPGQASLELGVIFAPALQRQRPASESFYVLFCYLFDRLGYRRLEWRTNQHNLASHRAAERLGLQKEGILRQEQWLKGEFWDTHLYALLAQDWPQSRKRLKAWLAADNFSANTRQRQPLRAFA
jgi:RimJ/RimL family protein N-acetyltransferase